MKARMPAFGIFRTPDLPLLILWLLVNGSGFAQSPVLNPLPGLGGSFLNATGLNAAGQVTGFATTPGDAAQHSFLHTAGVTVDLGTLGGSLSQATAINGAGQVTGGASITGDLEMHAFLYDQGSMIDLGTLGGPFSFAFAINDAGEVVGQSLAAGNVIHAFHYQGGQMTDLGTLGGSFSSATAINGHGDIAGDSSTDNFQTRAFLYRAGVMTDLGTLGGAYSVAAAINSSGHVAGDSSTSAGDTHAFLSDGVLMRDLGTLGGTFSTASGLNDSGEVIGDSALLGDAEFHGFLFTGGTMIDLGTLGGSYSTASAINNLGQVVGDSATATGVSHAFLFQNGQLTDLNSLLPADSGWELFTAYYINDSGRIVGFALYRGTFTWYLLTLAAGNRPPLADAGPDQAAECAGGYATVALDGSRSSDPDGDPLTFEWREGTLLLGTGASPTVTLALGSHTLTLTVTDSNNESSQDTVVVEVADTTPPVIDSVTADPNILFPPSRQMIPVNVTVVAADNCDPAPLCRIVSVRSDEPVTGPGDFTAPDWSITGPLSVELRAERAAKSAGRTYTIAVACSDASGNLSLAEVMVTVPVAGPRGGNKP